MKAYKMLHEHPSTNRIIGLKMRNQKLMVVFCLSKEISLVAVLAARRLELHKVFQGILEFLAKSSTPHTARCALSSVAVVIHSVLPHLEKLKDVSTYIIRSLIHILTCYTSSLQEVAPYLAGKCINLILFYGTSLRQANYVLSGYSL